VAPFRVPAGIPDGFADAWLRIGRGQDDIAYLVEVKRAVTASTVGGLVAQLRDRAAKTGLPTLLITPYLTPPVAAALRAQGQQFADAAGNAYLTGPAHYVYITGQRPKERGVPTHGGGTLTTNGLKILFALLCNPALAAVPQRTLAAAANVALGAVPGVLKDLQGEGHVVLLQGERRFRGTKRLLDEWAQGYARRLRPKTLHATYVTERFDAWRDWPLDPKEARWGGEPAAALLTDYLRPGVLTLYAERLPPRLLVEQRLKKGDHIGAQRYIEERRPFWGTLQVDQVRADVVPLVLVYADLLATGDGRCLETAQLLYEAHLARLLPAS
ncbi:MAG: type IV toxin-antitoxin system AbiEi family antitoxin, partial [Gammaproteobacteria bacterium]